MSNIINEQLNEFVQRGLDVCQYLDQSEKLKLERARFRRKFVAGMIEIKKGCKQVAKFPAVWNLICEKAQINGKMGLTNSDPKNHLNHYMWLLEQIEAVVRWLTGGTGRAFWKSLCDSNPNFTMEDPSECVFLLSVRRVKELKRLMSRKRPRPLEDEGARILLEKNMSLFDWNRAKDKSFDQDPSAIGIDVVQLREFIARNEQIKKLQTLQRKSRPKLMQQMLEHDVPNLLFEGRLLSLRATRGELSVAQAKKVLKENGREDEFEQIFPMNVPVAPPPKRRKLPDEFNKSVEQGGLGEELWGNLLKVKTFTLVKDPVLSKAK